MRARLAPAPASTPVTDGVTRYASVKVMADWFAAARIGESMIYATGPVLDPRDPADQLAKRWIREGKVAPKQKRAAGGRGFEYLLERSRGGASIVALAEAPRIDPESDAGRVYALLRRCANLAQPCPSNEAIAERAELKDRYRAKYCVQLLVARGLIRIEEPARFGPRVVTVVATGRTTPASAGAGRKHQRESAG